MRKNLLTLSAVCLLLITSCKKTVQPPEEESSPLHKIMDSKFLIYTIPPVIIVDYASYNPNQDLDKNVLLAAQNTVNGNYGFDKVQVVGKKITSIFERGSSMSPSLYELTRYSSLETEAFAKRHWLVIFTITKTNNLVTEKEFEDGVDVQIYREGSNGNQIKILEKRTLGNQIKVVCEMLFGQHPNENDMMGYQIQSNIAVKYSIEFDVDYAFNNSIRTIVPYPSPKIWEQPTLTNIGNNTTQFKGVLTPRYCEVALGQFLADYYWQKDIVPLLQ